MKYSEELEANADGLEMAIGLFGFEFHRRYMPPFAPHVYIEYYTFLVAMIPVQNIQLFAYR
jgi:hypothetical protein